MEGISSLNRLSNGIGFLFQENGKLNQIKFCLFQVEGYQDICQFPRIAIVLVNNS